MTNDPYRHLRIALADGKCVTDGNGEVHKFAIGNEQQCWEMFRWEEYYSRWKWTRVDYVFINENSRIVHDPSLPTTGTAESQTEPRKCLGCGKTISIRLPIPEWAFCSDCGHPIDLKESHSLTYEQALAAFMANKSIKVIWEVLGFHSHYQRLYGRNQISEKDAALVFDLAERRNYRMEAININD